jgi:periplasmic protein CpxP/Spy
MLSSSSFLLKFFANRRSFRLRHKFAATLSLFIAVIPGTQTVLADQNSSSHPSGGVSVPAMSEDFVRPPDLGTRDLTQPRPGDFRYMKMNYAASKGDADSNKEDSDSLPPPSSNKAFPGRPGEPGAGPPPGPGGMGLRPDKLGQIDLTPLNLTAEQKQKIQDMRKETGKKVRELRPQLKAKRDDLFNATFDPNVTEAAIREKREAVRALHDQLEDLMFDDLMGMRNLLTPEQKKHLAEVKPPPPPPGRFGGPGEGPPRMGVRMDGTKSDGFANPNIAKSDPLSKVDAGKGSIYKGDAGNKPDPNKASSPKN